MSDPKTVREVNFVLDGLERRVGLLVKVGGGIVGLLGVLLLTAFSLYHEIGGLSADIASIKTGMDGLNGRIERFETAANGRFDRIEAAINHARDQILARAQAPTSQQPQEMIAGGFYVTKGQAALIREFLKIPPIDASKQGKIGIWEHIAPEYTVPLPDNLAAKIGLANGLRYAVDPANNAIALVEPSHDVVVAII